MEPYPLATSEIPGSPLAAAPDKITVRKIRTIHIALSSVAAAVIIFLCWGFRSLLPYTAFLLPAFIALISLISKDWDKFKPKWVRWVLLGFVAISAIIGVRSQIMQQAERVKNDADRVQTAANQAAREEANKRSIEHLNSQIADQRKDFLSQYDSLLKQLRDLEIRGATRELNSEISQLRGQLENTRKALVEPIVQLKFSLEPIIDPMSMDKTFVPVTEQTVRLKQDGTIHIQIGAINHTRITAKDGSVVLMICNKCSFPREPKGMVRLTGMVEQQRSTNFQRILPEVDWVFFDGDIEPPLGAPIIEIAATYRCQNCEFTRDFTRFIIHIQP